MLAIGSGSFLVSFLFDYYNSLEVSVYRNLFANTC
jgi:hypothetical protein